MNQRIKNCISKTVNFSKAGLISDNSTRFIRRKDLDKEEFASLGISYYDYLTVEPNTHPQAQDIIELYKKPAKINKFNVEMDYVMQLEVISVVSGSLVSFKKTDDSITEIKTKSSTKHGLILAKLL